MEIIPNGSNDVNQGIEGQCTTKQQKSGNDVFTNQFDPVGAFIEAHESNRSNKHDSYEDAMRSAAYAGIIILKNEFRDEDLIAALRAIGYDVRWNVTLIQLEVQHEGGEWEQVTKDGSAIRSAVNEVTRRCAIIVKGGTEKNPYYSIKRIVHRTAWGVDGERLAKALLALRGVLVERVDPRRDWIVEQEKRVQAMSEAERLRLENKVKEAFAAMPRFKAKNSFHHRMAAKAGVLFFSMLGHRALQSHPDYKDRPIRSHPAIPIWVGDPEIGKTTIVKSMLHPSLPSGGEAVFAIRFSDKPDNINRIISRAMIVMLDDLDTYEGIAGRKIVGPMKELLTATHAEYRPLWAENVVNPPVSCAMIGTSNTLQLPNAEGVKRRFAPFILEKDPETWVHAEETVDRAREWIKDNFEDWFLGGLSRAMRNARVSLDESDARDRDVTFAETSQDKHGFVDCIKEMYRSGDYRNNRGVTRMAYCQIAQRAGVLRTSDGRFVPHRDKLQEMEYLRDAWNNYTNKDKLQNQIDDAMEKLGIKTFKQCKALGEKGRSGIVKGVRAFIFPNDWYIPGDEEQEGSQDDSYDNYQNAKDGNVTVLPPLDAPQQPRGFVPDDDLDLEGEY